MNSLEHICHDVVVTVLCICVKALCLNRFKKGETRAAHATLLADDACFINRCTLCMEVRNSRIVTTLVSVWPLTLFDFLAFAIC